MTDNTFGIELHYFHKKQDTYCYKDYKKHHSWEDKGTIQRDGKLYLVWRCFQCHQVTLEPLRELEYTHPNPDEISSK